MWVAVAATVLSVFTSNPSYRHWVNTFPVALPKVSHIQVLNQQCPNVPMAAGCVYYDKPTVIYMTKPDSLVFAHELGHVYDKTTMLPWMRTAFSRIMKYKQPWSSTGVDPHRVIGQDELFATAYQECATGWVIDGGYDFNPTDIQLYRICHMLRKR